MLPFTVQWMALAGLPWAHSAGSIFAIIKTDLSESPLCFLQEEWEGANTWHLVPVHMTPSRSTEVNRTKVPSRTDLGLSTFHPYRVQSSQSSRRKAGLS